MRLLAFACALTSLCIECSCAFQTPRSDSILAPSETLHRAAAELSMDANTTSSAAAPPRTDEPDSRNSLRHILAAEPAMDDAKTSTSQANTPGPDESEAPRDDAPDSTKPERPYFYTANAATIRRNANGSVSSVYSGNKIRHLKKDDGIPLWRKDIQYDFLKFVFEDEKRVFTKVDGSKGHTFADIYLDAMARSSKCSKILKDKLLTERPAAINMAMVCLLVNVGRMNTTLNCERHLPRRLVSF